MATQGKAYTVGGGAAKSLCLLNQRTTNLAAPTASTDGFPLYPVTTPPLEDGHAYTMRAPLHSTLLIKGRCTAGQTLVGTFTLWGYSTAADAWFEIPVNGGTAITPVALAETSSDQINFQQQFTNLGHYDRVAIELASIGGGGATFDAFLVTSQLGAQ